MKSICLIIPYYGKFPNYFHLWLKSVEHNPSIDFMIVTDIEYNYQYPPNVKLKYMRFDELKAKIQKMFDFKISLHTPYRLCEYKAAYGDIFYEDIKEYDFWGHCDIDLILGNLRKFVNDDILCKYDKVNMHGHFSLYRNTDDMRKLYKSISNNVINYKKVFRINWTWHFDEYPGVSYLCKEKNIKSIDIEDYADLSCFRHKFIKVYDHSEKKADDDVVEQIFFWKDGRLDNIVKVNNKIHINQVMYVHLQKRKMEIRDVELDKGFFIIPNFFASIEYDEGIKRISEYSIDTECNYSKTFKNECFWNRFKINYWRYKINMVGKKK